MEQLTHHTYSPILNKLYHNLLPLKRQRPEHALLGLGVRHAFVTKATTPQELNDTFTKLLRKVRLHLYFSNENTPSCDNEGRRYPFVPASRWSPPDIDLSPTNLQHLEAIRHKFKSMQIPTFVFHPCNEVRLLRSLKMDPNIHITAADKNLGLVVQTTIQYDKMIQRHLQDYTHYEKLDALAWDNRRIPILKSFLNIIKLLTPILTKEPKLLKYLSEPRWTLPNFHCLNKLHKQDGSGRPIVGAVDWISTRLSKYLAVELRKIHCEYVLPNSLQLIRELEGKRMPLGSTLVTFDVSSLYTMMHINLLADCVQLHLPHSPHLHDILLFICRNNYFCYAGDTYHQLDGIAMGTNCAVECANIYMDKFDVRFAPEFVYYRRYIDDGFGIFAGTQQRLTAILSDMSKFIPDIKITSECSDKDVVFLDLRIKAGDTISFSTYQKPANIYQYLTPTSAHPPSTLKGFIVGELIRYSRSNTYLSDRLGIISDFYLRLLRRGYSRSFLDPIFLGFDATIRHFCTAAACQARDRAIISIPFNNQPLTRATRNFMRQLQADAICPDLDFLLAYSRNTTLLQLISSTKLSLDQVELLRNAREQAPP